MIQIHPDDATTSIQLRQAIVRQGIAAARHPGDIAGLRERIGRLLISAGQRIQGRRAELKAPLTTRVAQLAR